MCGVQVRPKVIKPFLVVVVVVELDRINGGNGGIEDDNWMASLQVEVEEETERVSVQNVDWNL